MSDEGHIHIYVPDLEQPDHGRCGCGRDGTPTTYDWWKTAITQAAALAEARHTADNLAYNLDLVRRQLADVERERTDAYTQISGLHDDLRAVEAREAAARRALAEYGRHQATCRDADYADTLAVLVREGRDCECGWLRVSQGPHKETRDG